MKETIIYIKLLEKRKHNFVTIKRSTGEYLQITELGVSSSLEELKREKTNPTKKIQKQWNRLLKKEMKRENCYIELVQNENLWLEPLLAEGLDSYPLNYTIEYLYKIYQNQPKSDTLYIRYDEIQFFGEQIHQLIEKTYENCNELVLVTEEGLDRETNELIDYIYQDSGLLVRVVNEFPQQINISNPKSKGMPIIYDFSKKQLKYRNLPKQTILIDLAPTKQKERTIKEKRNDIQYYNYSDFI